MPTPDIINIKERVRGLPHRPGVYLMKDRLNRVIYVGKARDLKKRVATYFQPSRRFLAGQPKIEAMIKLVRDFDFIEVRSEAEALLLEGKLIKQWKPKYNTDFTDDKRFLLVRVDLKNELPRFRLSRIHKEDQSLYFGPFAHSGLLRKTLGEMRRRFGILLGDARPVKEGDGRWKLYDDIRSEIYGHANYTTVETYRKRVHEACVFLEGKSRQWLVELKAEMVAEAQKQNFERAAELRDIVFALEKTILKTRKFIRDPLALRPIEPTATLEDLRSVLALPTLPQQIECFDISHISGTFVVASMVQFRDGRPDRNHYRRFKIKSFIGNDDYRAMEEVVERRYLRLHKDKKRFPDLVVIDGGRGQLTAALRAFLAHGLEPPQLVGLAKKRETIHFVDERPPLNLPLHSEALKLLQRLRDEAHRFANTYSAQIRSRRIKETVLDEMAGLGPVKRKALLTHFKTIDALKKAPVKTLQKVSGIGPKLAARLHCFLHRETDR